VNPGLLGMSGVVAEDTLRRALKAIDESSGSEWLSRHIGRTVLGLLDALPARPKTPIPESAMYGCDVPKANFQDERRVFRVRSTLC
jgi:hypothetical protein